MKLLRFFQILLVFSVFNLDTGIHFGAHTGIGLQKAKASDNFESYRVRPKIENVGAINHNFDSSWEKLKTAHISFITELLSLYQHEHLYFLARDAELLYDTAVLLAGNNKELRNRLHLINVSRANMNDSKLKPYLAQEGISEQSLQSGLKIVFVDTGFEGTIPRVIQSNFNSVFRSQMQAHLVVSSSLKHPSSRVFLLRLNSAINQVSPSQLHSTIVSYEHLPRYTDRSRTFESIDGRVEPISPITTQSDGAVSKERALNYQQDLKAFVSLGNGNVQFQRELKLWSEIIDILKTAETKAQKIAKVQKFLKINSDSDLRESMVRDAFEAITKNQLFPLDLTVAEFGIAQTETPAALSKYDLSVKYPQFSKLLMDPDTAVPLAIKSGDLSTISALLDITDNQELLTVFAKELGKIKPSSLSEKTVITLIEKGNKTLLKLLAQHTLAQPAFKDSREILGKFVAMANHEAMEVFLNNLSAKAHVKEMKWLFEMIVDTGKHYAIDHIATTVFSRPESVLWTDLLEKVIQKGDYYIHIALAYAAFSKPHAISWKKYVQMVVETADRLVDIYLEKHTLNKPHAEKWHDLRTAIKIKDKVERVHFLKSQQTPHTVNNSTVGFDCNIKVGSELKVEDRVLKVIKYVDSGRRGCVFKVKDQKGRLYALKVARDDSTDTLKSIKNEPVKAESLKNLKIPHSTVMYLGSNFVIKNWIEGIRGDEVIANVLAGKMDKSVMESLFDLAERIMSQGAYVGDFRPKNLIWTGKAWFIIDSGGISEGLSFVEAKAKFDEKFQRRWQMPLAVSCSTAF